MYPQAVCYQCLNLLLGGHLARENLFQLSSDLLKDPGVHIFLDVHLCNDLFRYLDMLLGVFYHHLTEPFPLVSSPYGELS